MGSILLNDFHPLSALFRYCTAFNARDEAIFGCVLRKYKDAAIRHYIFNREMYDAIWGGWIPQEFKAEAESLYDKMLLETVMMLKTTTGPTRSRHSTRR